MEQLPVKKIQVTPHSKYLETKGRKTSLDLTNCNTVPPF